MDLCFRFPCGAMLNESSCWSHGKVKNECNKSLQELFHRHSVHWMSCSRVCTGVPGVHIN